MKTMIFLTILVTTIGASQARAVQCSELFISKPFSSSEHTAKYEKIAEEILPTVRLMETYPRYVLRSAATSEQVLFMTELASLSGRTQQDIAQLIDSVPSATFGRTTPYATRLRIVRLSVISGKSIEDTIAFMSKVPAQIFNYRMNAETYAEVVDIAAMTGREPTEIVQRIESIPNATFGRTTSWEFRLWLAKIGALANHATFAETEALIRSVPKSMSTSSRRISAETLATITELSAISGKSPVDIVKVIESIPSATWGRTTTPETRMWIAKLAILSNRPVKDIEMMGDAFPRYIMRSAVTGPQKRFIMSLMAVGQNKKAAEQIDRIAPPEPPIGFWEALGRYLFE